MRHQNQVKKKKKCFKAAGRIAGSDVSNRNMYTSKIIVINMVNFLNTVNMGRLEETRAQSHTRSQRAKKADKDKG